MGKVLRINGTEIPVDEDRPRPAPFHSPGEALQSHCELLDWLGSPEGLHNIGLLMRTRQTVTTALDENREKVPGDDEMVTEGYRSVLWDAVNFNNTMYVSAHMCDQLQALIPSFDDEPLWPTDLPDDMGTVLFEAGMLSALSHLTDTRYEDDSPLAYWIKGFVYRRVHGSQVESFRNGLHMKINIAPPLREEDEAGGVMIDIKNDSSVDWIDGDGVLIDEEPEPLDPRVGAFKEHDGILVWPLFDAGEMYVAPGQWIEAGEPPLLPMPFVAIPFGPKVDAFRPDAQVTNIDLMQMRGIVLTLFRLIWQHILVEEPFSRPEKRRMARIAAKRRRLPDDGEAIKVRHLRRLEHDTEPTPRDDEDPREGHVLTYRIIVKGHPREQHYPSLGPARNSDGSWNPESHRKIWISAHIRGPEDAPLVLKHSLDVVVR